MRIRWMVLLLVAPLAAGCVTRQTFEAKEAELAAERAAHETYRSQAQADRDTAGRERDRLEQELAQAAREVERLSEATAAARKYGEQLKAREQSLRERLSGELSAKEVEISRLRDQLAVRVLDKILFRSGSAEILPEGKRVLDKLAAVLAGTDDMIRIEGHTDIVPIGERLKEKYFSNWELSGARATSVVRYFEHGHDMNPLRMEAVGLSKYRPVAQGDTPADLQRNRRVEIILTAPRTLDPRAAVAPPAGATVLP